MFDSCMLARHTDEIYVEDVEDVERFILIVGSKLAMEENGEFLIPVRNNSECRDICVKYPRTILVEMQASLLQLARINTIYSIFN